MNKYKCISNEITTISVDAEWYGKSFLSVQLSLSDKFGIIQRYYIFSNDSSLVDCPNTYKGIEVIKVNYPIGLKGILEYFEILPKTLDCLFFYAPRDVESLLGAEIWTALLLGGYVNKRRNLNIKPYKLEFQDCRLQFIDLYGRFGCSLESAYNSVGIDTTNGKDYIKTLTIDKSRMDLFRSNHPKEFYEYALGDLELHKLAIQLKKLISDILKECFGLEDVYKGIKDYPNTIGSLVNDVFLRFIDKEYPGLLNASCLLSMTPNNKAAKSLEKYIKWIESGKSAYKVSKLIERDKRLIHGLGMCSIPSFFSGHYGLNDTSPFGGVVQGGRAIKEEQSASIFHDVLDIDLQSAYGSSLTRFDYPVGIPTTISFSNHTEKRVSLKTFLKKYRDDLIDGLYVIYVSGSLSHKQDLVFSKYELTSNNVGGKILQGHYEEDDNFEGRIGGQFLLTSKQIELGIITSEVLDVIEKVSTNKELKDWMNLSVDLAIYYPKSKELSLNDWINQHNHSSKIGILEAQNDSRSRLWCRFSLDNFIGKLLLARLKYKSKRSESFTYECKQILLKLFINTLYGDLASPFFSIGNTVVANNITASVRVGSWIVSKALSCKFTVTDGGIYSPLSVPTFKTTLKSFQKAGLETLLCKDSNWDKFVEFKPLFDINNSTELQTLLLQSNIQNYVDTKALEHINKFCEIYNIHFPFKIEHKLDHSGSLAVSNPYGKVDYIIYTYDGKEVIRVRGIQPKDYDKHPKVELLRALAEGREITFHGCLLSEIIGVNDYIRNPYRYGKDLPGYEVEMEYIHKPNKTGGSIFETYIDFSRAENAHKKRVSRYESKYKDISITLKPKFLV